MAISLVPQVAVPPKCRIGGCHYLVSQARRRSQEQPSIWTAHSARCGEPRSSFWIDRGAPGRTALGPGGESSLRAPLNPASNRGRMPYTLRRGGAGHLSALAANAQSLNPGTGLGPAPG
jgi:hypothetical protein